MKAKNSKAKPRAVPNPPPIRPIPPAVANSPAAAPDVPGIFVMLLISTFAAGLVIAQFYFKQNPHDSQLSLSNLDQRADALKEITDLVQRDAACVPLSAYGRSLDRALPKDARVFLTGMIGETNGSSLGYYYFLRNYLFPRDVEISLDGKGVFHGESWVIGIPCDSPAVLQTNGFDLMIRYANSQMQLIPLTPKGVPKSE